MSPLERYRRRVESGGFERDPAQERALRHFERLQRALQARESPGSRLLRRLGRAPQAERGVWLWGGVGRGKTQLMDLFYESLSAPGKQRVHFHRFMHGVHAELRDLSGAKNPLQKVAARLCARTRTLCLDEFLVADIADAMILGGLLRELFRQGLVLVATSNTALERLYEDGLQRQRFLPAIELLRERCLAVRLEDGVDYRLRALERAPLYHCPADRAAEQRLEQSFLELAPDGGESRAELEVNGRRLHARRLADDVAWFDFSELCETPCGQRDYIELGREFHALLLSGAPRFTAERDDAARRFIHLIDVLYDRNVKLILSAADEPEALYQGERLKFDFQRTASRLHEMRGRRYLERAHKG